jgi:uncharacterized protein YhbP (UPF0306 family)
MASAGERELVETILRRNRYLVLSTTNGTAPWIAPLEYMIDGDLNFYVFSPDDSRHVRDLEMNEKVAVVVFEHEQGEYSPEASFNLNGVQMEAVARRVPQAEYSADIVAAIDALKPPMPSYSVFKIEPRRFYLPEIRNGVNIRTEVSMGGD